jgi:putative copper export protein
LLVLETLSQTLLYLCFALLMGTFLLYMIPKNYRVDIFVPKGVLLVTAAGIAILSFFPVFHLILYLAPEFGFGQSTKFVLFSFEVGKAWIFTFVVSIILFIFIIWFDYRKKFLLASLGVILTFILVLTLGWSSHASTYDKVWGFFSHSLHLTAVSVWVGTLMVVSWFSKDHANWLNFLKWFSPVAIVCFVSTFLTGLILMSFVMEFNAYTTSWLLPYGQALLIKHILIIPLLIFAIINSFFARKRLKRGYQYDPRPWARIESIIIMLIFSATAALGQQSPPHETAVSNEEVSSLFKVFHQGPFYPEMTVQLIFNPVSIALSIITALFVTLIIFLFFKKGLPIFSFIISILLVFCVYLSLILSISLY